MKSQDTTRILVENHRRFRSFLAKRVGSEALAEDLLQVSLKKALESSSQAENESGIVAWFFQILRNTLIDHYRSQASEKRNNEGFLQALVVEGKAHTSAADEIEAGVCECLGELLPTLKDAYAVLIRRVDLDGEEISQVARDLRISENNLSVRLHRARQAMKVSLERACGTCTEHGCMSCDCE